MSSNLFRDSHGPVHHVTSRCTLGPDSSAYQRVHALNFMSDERVLLKESPMKDVKRFRKKVKLRTRFISPFETVEDLEKNYPTYDLELAAIIFILKLQRHYLCEVHYEVDQVNTFHTALSEVKVEKLARLYISQIDRLYGVLISIVSI
ncbi:hypothetical protein MTR67_042880 [Solanum verrucosum]|uniref:Uncharacterized protein n=1 Tax=Solanum verrucosum TaxID=315347 RepID=A0AAF0UN54_SOLVR|nr:hypothetical protein MTR67_042880 [Solanum verrucosum]